MDVPAFFSELLQGRRLAHVIHQRSQNFSDLTWETKHNRFELAIELKLPKDISKKFEPAFDVVRHEMAVETNSSDLGFGISEENVLLLKAGHNEKSKLTRKGFPQSPIHVESIMLRHSTPNSRIIIRRKNRNAEFFLETHSGKSTTYRLSHESSALSVVPETEAYFPVYSWLRDTLPAYVNGVLLDTHKMRKSSQRYIEWVYIGDGSNFPWLVYNLEKQRPNRFDDWVRHVQTAVPGLTNIRSVFREEDNSRYLKISFVPGFEVPSWVVSEGTLRLLALTLIPYWSKEPQLWLIEEPENGVHPSAIQAIFDSLSSVYNGQVLLATHSPLILSLADPNQVLCFAKTEKGETDIVRGSEHPMLRDWQGDTDFSTYFASGILG